MAFPAAGQVVFDQGEVVGVVEDGEPAVVGGEPVLDGGHDDALVLFVAFGQLQQAGQVDEAGDEGIQRGGIDPQDVAVLVLVAIGVFDGGLGFADAAQSVDGLCLPRCCWRGCSPASARRICCG